MCGTLMLVICDVCHSTCDVSKSSSICNMSVDMRKLVICVSAAQIRGTLLLVHTSGASVGYAIARVSPHALRM